MSENAKVKREYKELAEKDYARILAALEGKAKSNPPEYGLYLEMLHIVEAYFTHMKDLDKNEPYFNVEPLIDFVSGQKKLETQRLNHLTGCFIASLALLGSSDNQAYLATAEFMGYSTEHCTKVYAAFMRKNSDLDGMKAKQFIYLNAYGLKKFLNLYSEDYTKRMREKFPKGVPESKKGFPSGPQIKKARKAYERLLLLINQEITAEPEKFMW